MNLNRNAISHVPDTVYTPRYDPALLRPGIVHLGCGNFHRGHQVVATQAAIDAEGRDGLRWGIVSATMRRPDLATVLQSQDNLYTLLTREPANTVASVMAAITEAVYAGDDNANLAARIADPATAIVTLTVTASGYYLSADGRLDPTFEAIQADLTAITPRTAPGIIAAGLAQVRQRGGVPPVILCCDNVNSNGDTLRQAVIDLAALKGDDLLAAWIETNVQFPNTMVDRIVPTATPDDIADACRLLGGIEDRAPISAEPWFQWVIGEFDGPRPRWVAHPGTKFVSDVGVFERAKLQMLNGTHMLLAYVGALANLNTISEAASDDALGRIAARFMRNEQTADVSLDTDELDRYTVDLMQRFRNPGIVHEVTRIGRNGSAKMASRIVQPMRSNIETRRPVDGAVLLIASWIRWFALHEQDEFDIALTDPRAETLRGLCADARDDYKAQAEAFLAMEEVFGAPLPDHGKQVEAIASMLRRLTEESVPELLRTIAH